MPGFDGTGPRGEGPMTGGGRGFCISNFAERRASGFYGAGRGGMPWGGGRGRAWGGGRGWGRGMGRGYGWGFAAPQPSAEDERTYLADQLSALENEMREIKERLEKLDKDKDKDKNKENK